MKHSSNCLIFCCNVLAIFFLIHQGDAFHLHYFSLQERGRQFGNKIITTTSRSRIFPIVFDLESSKCLAQKHDRDDRNNLNTPVASFSCKGFSTTKFKWARVVVALFAAVFISNTKPRTAHASAPVMAMPKADSQDPAAQALQEHERRMVRKQQDELKEFARKAREIEAEQGESARKQFEKDYKEQQKIKAEEKLKGLISLKRKLLDEGIVYYIDLEGRRQVILYEKGIDLGKVPGTPFYLEKMLEKTAVKRSMAHKTSTHRKIIACMVQDMKNRGIDPLDYIESHPDKIEAIINLPLPRALALLKEYSDNLELYGQILPQKLDERKIPETGTTATKSSKQSRADKKRAKLMKQARPSTGGNKREKKVQAKQSKFELQDNEAEDNIDFDLEFDDNN